MVIARTPTDTRGNVVVDSWRSRWAARSRLRSGLFERASEVPHPGGDAARDSCEGDTRLFGYLRVPEPVEIAELKEDPLIGPKILKRLRDLSCPAHSAFGRANGGGRSRRPAPFRTRFLV